MITMYIAVAILSTWTLTNAAFDVAVGGLSTCAINEGQGVECWGSNEYGQLGLGHTTDVYEPTDSVDLGSDFEPKEVGCGHGHCCSVSVAASLKCWGRNDLGMLGYGDLNNRGDESGEMGDDLEVVQLPTGFLVDELIVLVNGNCVVSTESEIVCFGYNERGSCGVGHSENIGDGADEMGDYLVAVDLGADFDLAQLGGGGYSPCAVSTVGAVKCWGWNKYGSLGLGDLNHRGDASNEMGDYLPYVDLGTDFYAISVKCSHIHCCAVSVEGQLKCMGRNGYGQLGYEDNTDRGDNTNEMGDYLGVVSLGDDFIVSGVYAQEYSTCALSTSGDIKCFGYNGYGQLGYGDTKTRGSTAGSMGNALAVVDIGSGFTGTGLQFATTFAYVSHVCVFEESTELLAKCWGRNTQGQLGYGDTENRGDGTDEMGDFLPFIGLNFTAVSQTSAVPTTAAPTSVPTAIPSVSPTDPLCDAAEMYGVDWHELLNEDGQDTALLHGYSVEFDASTLSLTLVATLEYVGLSADGNFDKTFNLGTTYWIDLQSFSALGDSYGVDSAGTCANRRSDDYKELDFDDFFGFTTNPMDLESVDTSERMAYPPSNWTLTASSCNVVEYEKTFSWTELTACVDAAGNALVSVTETDDSVLLEGTFFVELVSPYSMSSDEYYRSFPLIQQDFGIALSRTINVLSSTKTQLFIASVIGWGKEGDAVMTMNILIQSADYVQMQMDDLNLISAPNGLTVSDFETVTTGCLVASSFTCGQIFTATIPAVCPEDDPEIDLSGTYQFAFSPECRDTDDGASEACETFMGTLDDTDGKVVLDVDVSFVIDCSVDLFAVEFGAEMAFYSDAAFTEEVGDESNPFVIGQDTIYGKVTVDIPDEIDLPFSGVEIEAVYVCTAEDSALLSLDSDTGLGGCLSSYIDADGPYKVIGSDAVTDYQGNTAYSMSVNEAAFSFLTFDTARTTIHVHVQLLVTMETDGVIRRRRMLLQSGGEGNALKSYMGSALLQESTTNAPREADGAFAFSVAFIPAMFAVIGWLMM